MVNMRREMEALNADRKKMLDQLKEERNRLRLGIEAVIDKTEATMEQAHKLELTSRQQEKELELAGEEEKERVSRFHSNSVLGPPFF